MQMQMRQGLAFFKGKGEVGETQIVSSAHNFENGASSAVGAKR